MAAAKTRFRELLLKKSADLGRRLTYGDVAKETGLSEGTIERYANDRFTEPPWRVVKALARYFGVSDDYLMCESDDPQLMAVA